MVESKNKSHPNRTPKDKSVTPKKKLSLGSPQQSRPVLHTPKNDTVDVFHEDQKILKEPTIEEHLKLPFKANLAVPWTQVVEKKQTLISPELKEIHEGKARCQHMWPTAAHLIDLQNKKKPWKREYVMNILDIEFYFGRVPLWYIEEKLLKVPGDFLLSRAHDNTPRISVVTHEKDNPVATFTIAFEQTLQNKSDRNYYYRIVGTTIQSNSIWGLTMQYRQNLKLLEEQTKRKASLIHPVIPCQNCVYDKSEYYFFPMHIRDFGDLVPADPIRIGRDAKVLKGVRNVVNDHCVPITKTKTNVIIKEFEEYTTETLDKIFQELHIVQTIRHTIGVDTVVNVDGVYVFKKPYSITYTECDGGCLLDYIKVNRLEEKQKILILLDLATTLAHMHQHQILHCDIQAKNIFVDTKGPHFLFGGMHFATRSKARDGPALLRINKDFPHSPRYTAPEVALRGILNENTDVYAFGMMMFEVLKGEKPIKALDDDIYWKRLKSDPHMRPCVIDLPGPLKKLMEDCWQITPTCRPGMEYICLMLYNYHRETPESRTVAVVTEKTQSKSNTAENTQSKANAE